MMTDPIADFLTRIRNSLLMKRAEVKTRDSRMARRLADILQRNGYIEGFGADANENQVLELKLRYDEVGVPLIDGLKRVSRPGLRVYMGKEELPKVRGGLGISIVSTSRGVMTGAEAQKLGVGGEVLCYVW